MMDAMVEVQLDTAQLQPVDPSMPALPTLSADQVSMPEGMDLNESSLGVIP